jgi:hypothetical protein
MLIGWSKTLDIFLQYNSDGLMFGAMLEDSRTKHAPSGDKLSLIEQETV